MLRKRTNNKRMMPIPGCAPGLRVFAQSEDGQSLVEMVLTLPAFLLVVVTVLYFGTVLYDYIALSEATQVGLRQLVISRGQTTDPCSTVANAVSNSTAAMNDAKLVYSLTLNGASYTGTSCSAAAANMTIGANALIKITYPGITTITTQEQDRIQ